MLSRVPYPHLVEQSPWPLLGAVGGFGMTSGGVLWWHTGDNVILVGATGLVFLVAYEWWSNVVFENHSGFHNSFVVRGLRLGMILFITSEVMFFFSFFWAYFSNCFNPESEVGFTWPPVMFDYVMVDPFSIPLLNSVLLLSSGATVTAAHHYILKTSKSETLLYLTLTVMLGGLFLFLQVFEYAHSYLSMKSTVYGATFFLLTGFHGLHVTVGVMALLVCLLRIISVNVSNHNHVGFEVSAWYWHFVDVVWLFLYFFVYWYGFTN